MINTEIIKIASDTSNCGIKANSEHVATSKNKICGDKITVEIEISNNRIERMSYKQNLVYFVKPQLVYFQK